MITAVIAALLAGLLPARQTTSPAALNWEPVRLRARWRHRACRAGDAGCPRTPRPSGCRHSRSGGASFSGADTEPGAADAERFSAEAQASAIATAVPLTTTLRQVIERLERAPAQVTVQRNGQPVTVVLSPFDIRILLAVAMERRDTMRNVPAFIAAMAAGHFEQAAAQIAGVSQAPIPTLMNLATECASGGTSARRAQIAGEEQASLVGRAVDFPQPDICDLMGAEDLGDAYRSPVRSDIPALLISGELDSRTPPSNAEEVRAGLPNATHLVVARAGHDDDLLVSSPALTGSIVSFLAGQSVADGRIELPPIPFTVPNP